jgi:hypothetical protein
MPRVAESSAGSSITRAPSRCSYGVTPEDGKKLLLDFHGGICGHHATLRALKGKAFRHGFYWPTALADAQDLIKTCKGYQYYTKQSHLSTQAL